MKWTPEDDQRLIEGLEANMTYAEIGAPIGRTRKAVGGRVHTLNLPKRHRPELAALRAIDDLEPLTPYIEPERPQRGCQWIEGDPKEEHSFCGEHTEGGQWCEEHRGRVYIKIERQPSPYPAPRPELRNDFR